MVIPVHILAKLINDRENYVQIYNTQFHPIWTKNMYSFDS